MATPTKSSRYHSLACALSMARYPACSAHKTACVVPGPRPAVPNPTLGIRVPVFRVTKFSLLSPLSSPTIRGARFRVVSRPSLSPPPHPPQLFLQFLSKNSGFVSHSPCLTHLRHEPPAASTHASPVASGARFSEPTGGTPGTPGGSGTPGASGDVSVSSGTSFPSASVSTSAFVSYPPPAWSPYNPPRVAPARAPRSSTARAPCFSASLKAWVLNAASACMVR
mmetsp:Transcript_10295/g.38178  ORF Transcript_10295/g.38178 Transcript_10295/m.38178 type:complete len:224 (-) Transcript_10295:123-794(-)